MFQFAFYLIFLLRLQGFLKFKFENDIMNATLVQIDHVLHSTVLQLGTSEFSQHMCQYTGCPIGRFVKTLELFWF